MGYARYVGRVGALAVALGIGAAVATTPGAAWADDADPAASSSDSGQSAQSTDPGSGADAAGQPGAPADLGSVHPSDSQTGDEAEESSGGKTVTTDGSEPETESETGQGTEPESEPKTEPKTEPETEPEAEPSANPAPVKSADHDSSRPHEADSADSVDAPQTPVSDSSTDAEADDEVVTAETTVSEPEPSVSDNPLVVTANDVEHPAAQSDSATVSEPVSVPTAEVTNVLTTLLSPLAGLDPNAPVESPLLWVLAAAARRQFGAAEPVAAVTGEVSTGLVEGVVVPGADIGAPDPTTGTVSGSIVPPEGPAGKKPSYTVVSPPGQGTLTLNKTTGAFSYTPTAAQRVLAGLTDEADAVSFTVNVKYGTSPATPVTVSVPVSPTQISDLGSYNIGSGAAMVAATTDRAYVTDYLSGTVTVIDTINGVQVGDPIEVGDGAYAVAVSKDGKRVYVTRIPGLVIAAPSTVVVIDTATQQVVGAPIPVGKGAGDIAISPDGKTLYVANTGDGSVSKINTSTFKVATVKGVVPKGMTPAFITVSADGKKVFLVSLLNPAPGADVPLDASWTALSVFSPTSTRATVVAELPGIATGFAVSPDNKWVVIPEVGQVGDEFVRRVTLLDGKTYQPVSTAQLDSEPVDVVFNSDSTMFVVATAGGTLKVFAVDSGENIGSVELGDGSVGDGTAPQLALTPDGLRVFVTDPSGGSVHEVSLVPAGVKPVAGDPVINAPNASGVVSGNVGVSDADGDRLTYTVIGAPGKGKVVLGPDGSFAYTPSAAARHAAAANGAAPGALTDTFTVRVDDGRRGVVTQQVSVDIKPANVVPVVKVSAPSPNAAGVVKGSITVKDADKDSIGITGPVSGTSAKGAAVTVDAKGRFVYTPSAALRHAAAATGADQTDTFTITVDDGHGGVVAQSVAVTIKPANAKPTQATVVLGAADENTGAVVGQISAVDTDGDDFTLAGPVSTKKGTLVYDSVTDRFTYTPIEAARAAAYAPGAGAAAKTDKFSVTVDDGHGGLATIAVTATIMAPGNQNPGNGGVDVAAPSGARGVVTGTVTAQDPNPGDVLSYSGSQTMAKGKVVVAKTGEFTYTPTAAARHAAAADGADPEDKQDHFTVTVSDGRGGFATVPVMVTISPANTNPSGKVKVGKPDTTTGVVTGRITTTDADKDTRTLSAPATSAKGGTVEFTPATGVFTYTPTAAARAAAAAPNAPAQTKLDTFTITINDGHGGTTELLVSAGVAPAVGGPTNAPNTAPINGKSTITTTNTVTGVVTGTVSATDPDGDTLTYSAPASTTKGSITLVGNTFTYTPTQLARVVASASGGSTSTAKQDSFTITADDGHGHTLVVLATVPITPPSVKSPEAVDGIAVGNAVIGATGTAYQVITDPGAGSTYVQLISKSGASTLTPGIAGIPNQYWSDGRVLAQTNGGIVLTTFTSDSTIVSTISAGGTVNSLEIKTNSSVGVVPSTGPLVMAADGTAYQAVHYLQTGAQAGTWVGVVRVTPDGQMSLQKLPAGYLGDSRYYGLVVAPNGTAFVDVEAVQYSGTTPVKGGVGILAIPPTGAAYVSDLVVGAVVTADDAFLDAPTVAVGRDSSAYLTVRNSDEDTTVVLKLSPMGTTTIQKFAGTDPEGLVSVGADGSAFQTVSTFASGVRTVYIKQIGGSGSAAAPGQTRGDLMVSADGTAYQKVLNNGYSMLILSRTGSHVVPLPSGSTSTVVGATGAAEFVLGPDGNLYSYSSVDQRTVVITSNGTMQELNAPITGLGSFSLYTTVPGPTTGTVRIKNIITGDTSTSAKAGGGLAVGPTGLAVYTTPDASSTPSSTKVLAMTANGTTVADLSEPGYPVGNTEFGADGTAYVLIKGSDPVLEVVAITGSGTSKLVVAPGGTPSISGNVTGFASGNGNVYVTTATSGGASSSTQVNTMIADPVKSAIDPYSDPISAATWSATPDLATGMVTGSVKFDPGPGVAVNYSGSTVGALGSVVVKPDGTFTFTPTAQARDYAEASGRALNAVFAITATYGDGRVVDIPVSVRLVRTNSPTNASDVPNFVEAEALKGFGLGISDTADNPYGPVMKTTLYEYCDAAGCWRPGSDAGLNREATSATFNLKRVGSYPLVESDVDHQLRFPDVYVIAMVDPSGEDEVLQSDTFGKLAIGYRKMELGDDITIKQDFPRPGTGTVGVTYTYLPFTVDNPFPSELFEGNGIVGGYIFNHEIPAGVYELYQDMEYDAVMAQQVNDDLRVHNALQKAGDWAHALGPLAVEPNPISLGGVIAGVKGTAEGLEIITSDDEYHAQYDGNEHPMYIAVGRVIQASPTIGIPEDH